MHLIWCWGGASHTEVSWGAMVGLLASSRHSVTMRLRSTAGPGFAAVASFYPGCYRIYPANGAPPYEILNPDIAQSLLVLKTQR